MKKTILILTAMLGMGMYASAQDSDPDSKYIRNSLYMLKLDMAADDEEYAHAYDIMNKTFDGIDFAKRYERYNDFSLANRHIDWTKVPSATSEEMDAIAKETKKDQLLKKALTDMGIKVDPISEREYAARILKYFNENKVANQLVAKWHIAAGQDPSKVTKWDGELSVIMELGMKGLSEEARANAKASENLINACSNSENKLMNTTYVCVNNYRMLTAKEKSATPIALAEVALQFMPGPAKIAGQAAVTAAKMAAEKTKGYFVKTNAYLFKLDWNQEKNDAFYKDYWDAPTSYTDKANYTLTYVGKSSKTAGAGMTLKASKVDELTARGAIRATDAAFAALQRDNEEFRPMCSLHAIDGKLGAYIGKKEGIKDGDKFDVFMYEEKTANNGEWKKIGTIKVAKNSVWDNTEGAGQTIEDAAQDGDEEASNNTLTYTVFDGKPSKKIGDGCMIRLAK